MYQRTARPLAMLEPRDRDVANLLVRAIPEGNQHTIGGDRRRRRTALTDTRIDFGVRGLLPRSVERGVAEADRGVDVLRMGGLSPRVEPDKPQCVARPFEERWKRVLTE